MASNEIKLTLKVDDKGGLSIVGKKAKKATSEVEKLNKSQGKLGRQQDSFHKKEKALTQGTLSSGRAMSKLNQTIGGGSSGLVGAYAVLAANVFAATAAFGVFQRAAQMDQLVAGLQFVGNAAGQNLTFTADRLKEITGAAVSTEQAMRATATAFSAGINTAQLEGLTKIAKGASLALGRDMGDALDRLVRGVAKLEPEILDEIGLFVRLDDAARTFARERGKDVNTLSQYERRQAFLNATLEQGSKKFFDIAEAIDVNPYDKLAASLANLQKQVVGAFNNFAGLSNVVDFFARNLLSLAAVATTLGGTLIRSIAPSLYQMDVSAARAADSFALQNAAMLSSSATAGTITTSYKAAVDAIAEGDLSTQAFAKAQKELKKSDKAVNTERTRQVGINDDVNKQLTKAQKKTSALAKQETALTKIRKASQAGNLKALATDEEFLAIGVDRRTVVGKIITDIENENAVTLENTATKERLLEAEGKLATQTKTATKAEKELNKARDSGQKKVKIYDRSLQQSAQNAEALDDGLRDATKGTYLHTRASAVSKAANFQLGAAFKDVGQATREYGGTLVTTDKNGKRVNKMFKGLRTATFSAAAGVRVLGAAFMTALPYIGLILTAGTLLFEFLKEKFFPEDIVQKRVEEATESFTSFIEIEKQFQESSTSGAERAANAYVALSGVLQQIETQLKGLRGKIAEINTEELQMHIRAEEDINAQLEKNNKFRDIAKQYWFFYPSYLGFLANEVRLRANIREEQEKQNRLQNETGAQYQAGALSILRNGLDQMENASKLAKKFKMDAINDGDDFSEGISVFNLEAADRAQEGIGNLIKRLGDLNPQAANFSEKVTEILKDFYNMTAPIHDVALTFAEVEEKVIALNTAVDASFKKMKKPYEDIEEAAQGVFDTVKGLQAQINALESDPAKNKNEIRELGLAREAALKVLKKMNLKEEYIQSEDALQKLIARIREFQDANSTLTKKINAWTSVLKTLEGLNIQGFKPEVMKMTNDLLDARIAKLQGERDLISEITGDEEKDLANQQEIVRIDGEIVKLTAQRTIHEQRTAEKQKYQLHLLEQQDKLIKARAKTEIEQLKFEARMERRSRQNLSPVQELRIAEQQSRIAIEAAERQLQIANNRVQVELAITEAIFAQAIATTEDASAKLLLIEAREKALGLLKEQLEFNKLITKEQIEQARIAANNKVYDFATAGTKSGAGLQGGPTAGIVNNVVGAMEGMAGVRAASRLADSNLEAAQANEKAAEQYFKSSTLSERMEAAKKSGISAADFAKQEDDASQALSDAIEESHRAGAVAVRSAEAVTASTAEGIKSVFDQMAESFKALGPEGEFGAAIASATGNAFAGITTGLTLMADSAENTKMRIAGALTAVGATMGSLASVMAASNKQKVAGIDQEIQAEKDRDGQSAKSLARIKQLEGRKDAIARKAFETNKKLMMAQTIINTAAAVMGILAIDGSKVGSFAIPLAVAVGAMGAAQLAIIAGMTYQGGGSGGAGAVSAPSAVSAGSRGSSVDVGSRAGSGELAYLRGARGSGSGPEDFIGSAFYGKKMRAAGGAVAGYTVGEQGPELFVPEVPGTIVPNDDIGMGQNVNVSFNVQAIDASSFNDALTVQRGNIIEIIREAANSSGEGFLESVDTQSLI